MSDRQLLHRAEYAAYQVVAGVTQRLPLRALRAWGRGVGRLAYHLMRGRRALAIDNLARAMPELDAGSRRDIARRCFEIQGATYHEQVWALRRGKEIADRFEIVGGEHFEAARARGKGVFILTGHYGCWEIAAYPLGRMVEQIHIVARPQNNPYIAAHFEKLRESTGNVQIDRGRAAVRMLRVLRKGGVIGIAIDQRVRPSHSVLVPFLGRYAWTSRLPAQLSTMTGCAAVPMVCVPLDDGGYRMTFDPPILPEGEGDDEIERLTGLYVAALEPWIRKQPELWLWLHSRWRRTRPLRRPEAIARLVAEARLPPAASLRTVAKRSAPSSPARRLGELACDAFLEDCRHLLLVAHEDGGSRRPHSPAAASFGDALARLGHAVRYLPLDALVEMLQRAREEERLAAAMRDLDAVPLVVIDRADPRDLDAAALELMAGFLDHRRERGSVVLAGASAAAWREAAPAGTATNDRLRAYVDACETIELSPVDTEAFAAGAIAAPATAPRGLPA